MNRMFSDQLESLLPWLSPASSLYLPVLKATGDIPPRVAPDVSLVQTV